MAKPEDAAKEFLKGLGARGRMPWDEPVGERPAPRKAAPAKSESKPADSDPIGSQVEAITKRNADIAKRTRHLRGGSY